VVDGGKNTLDEYRRKSTVYPRLPDNLHDLLHGIPILPVSRDMGQILELDLQCGHFGRAGPSIVTSFWDTLFQTKVYHYHREPIVGFENGHDPVC